MKKQINMFCTVIIVMALGTLNAQTIAFHPSGKTTGRAVAATVANEEISDNVQKKFKKTFPGITGESWEKIDNGYSVVFRNGNVQNRVYFTQKGNIRLQMSYYNEAELPADIRARVKSVYYDYNIFTVQEINLDRTKFYLVSLEDKNTWKIIRVDENGMEVYKEYVKG